MRCRGIRFQIAAVLVAAVAVNHLAGRLQIGSYYLVPEGTPTGCDLRLPYHDAEVAGTITTEKHSEM